MMGAHHAACGAAAWVAVASSATVPLTALQSALPFLPDSVPLGLGLIDVTPAGLLVGAIVTAGAALLPDADHHNATIAHSLPPISNAICSGVGAVSGGHRGGTHSILGIVAMTWLAWLAGLATVDAGPLGQIQIGAGVVALLLVSFAVKALKFIPQGAKKSPWVIGILVALLVAFSAPEQNNWLVISVALGVVVHITGDMMTVDGCNLLWPLKIKPPASIGRNALLGSMWKPGGALAVPVLGKAESIREWIFLIPVSAYAIFGILAGMVDLGTEAIAQATRMFK